MLEIDSVGRQDAIDFIEHYNVKGAKWGVHKFGKWQKHAVYAHGRDDPNKKTSDKSSTREERKQARADKKKAKEALRKQKSEEEAKKKAAQEEQDRKAAKEKALKDRDPILAYKNRQDFSDQELRDLINRVSQENTLRDLASKEQQRRQGKSFISKLKNLNKNVNDLYDIYESKAVKALRKEVYKTLGIKPKESFIDKLLKSSDIEQLWKNYDKLTPQQQADALKRASTRNAMEKLYKQWLREHGGS